MNSLSRPHIWSYSGKLFPPGPNSPNPRIFSTLPDHSYLTFRSGGEALSVVLSLAYLFLYFLVSFRLTLMPFPIRTSLT